MATHKYLNRDFIYNTKKYLDLFWGLFFNILNFINMRTYVFIERYSGIRMLKLYTFLLFLLINFIQQIKEIQTF